MRVLGSADVVVHQCALTRTHTTYCLPRTQYRTHTLFPPFSQKKRRAELARSVSVTRAAVGTALRGGGDEGLARLGVETVLAVVYALYTAVVSAAQTPAQHRP
jgi:hypothetical protein